MGVLLALATRLAMEWPQRPGTVRLGTVRGTTMSVVKVNQIGVGCAPQVAVI
jgi:hypothetical protein